VLEWYRKVVKDSDMYEIKKIIKKLWDFSFKTEKGLYLVFGVLTTLISLIAFYISKFIFGNESDTLSTIIKHIAGIIFAYFTNRSFVFKSENVSHKAKAQEAVLFVGTRLITLGIDWLIVTTLKYKVGIDSNIGTIIGSVVVIVLNYIASKLYIFKRKD